MEAIGLHLDGQVLKLAHIHKKKNRFIVLALESVILPDRKDGEDEDFSKHDDSIPSNEQQISGDIFPAHPFGKEQTNCIDPELLVNLLGKYPLHKAPLGISVPESTVHFSTYENFKGLKGKNLIKELKSECAPLAKVQGNNASEFDPDTIHFVESDDNNYLLLNCNGNVPLLNKLLELKSAGLLNNKMSISLVTPWEIPIAQLAGKQNRQETEKPDIVIYFGIESTRILLVKNGVLSIVSPLFDPYSNGTGSSFIDMVYAKLLLILDQVDIPEPGRLMLTGELPHGESGEEQALEYFQDRFPNSECLVIPGPGLDCSFLNGEETEDVPAFAVPIGMAISMLSKQAKEYRNSNLLPGGLRKSQSSRRLSWHGYAAILLLFVGSLFQTQQWFSTHSHISKTEFKLGLVEDALRSEQDIAQEISAMESKTKQYREYRALTDSLWLKGPLYSETLRFLAQTSSDVNSLWLQELDMTNTHIQLAGRSLYRNRIHRFAEIAGNAIIRSVSEEDVRGYRVYKFDLSGSPQNFADPGFLSVYFSDTDNVDSDMAVANGNPGQGKEK